MSDDESYEYDDDDGDDAQDDFDYTDDEQDPEDGHVALGTSTTRPGFGNRTI